MKEVAGLDGLRYQELVCGPLSVQERALAEEEMGGVVGGQGNPMEAAKNYGIGVHSVGMMTEQDPYRHYFSAVNDAAACGVADVQGDSTAVGVKSVAERTSNWLESAWNSTTSSVEQAWSQVAEVLDMSSLQFYSYIARN